MGPGALEDHLELIIVFIEQLLDKTHVCQTGKAMESEEDGPTDEQDDDDSGDEEEDDDEDLNHDELILGNISDLIVSLGKCLADSFMPYLQRLGPRLVKYMGDDHPRSDKIMVVGCLAETFNQCPSSMTVYFNDFFSVLLKHSKSKDSSLNRNVAYAIAVCAEKATNEIFVPHLQAAMQAIKKMHKASAEEDAKDNCIACFVRILERYQDKLPQDEYNVLFQQIMESMPLMGDPSENQTLMKYVMNLNVQQPDKVLPYMEKITLTCLKLLTDARCKRDIDESFKVMTAKFIKNVIMNCGRDDVVQQL